MHKQNKYLIDLKSVNATHLISIVNAIKYNMLS